MMSHRIVDARAESGSDSSSGSDSGSTCDEERLRQLFISCDEDGDGFIDSNDLLTMCERLNMLDAVTDLQQQLGMDQDGMISFQQFLCCHSKLMGEIEAVKTHRIVIDPSGKMHPEMTEKGDMATYKWQTSSENSLANSGIGYDSGAQDIGIECIELPTIMKLLETHELSAYEKYMNDPKTSLCIEMVNELHIKSLSALKSDFLQVSGRLHQVSSDRDVLEKQVAKLQSDRLHTQRDNQQRLEQMSQRYEERITELHSVIAELQKKFERTTFNVIREEDEFEETPEVGNASNKSEISISDNNANAQSISADEDSDLPVQQISHVVSELENSEPESDAKKTPTDTSPIYGPTKLPGKSPSTPSDGGPIPHCNESSIPPPPPPRSAKAHGQGSESTEYKLRTLTQENEHLKAYTHDLEKRLQASEEEDRPVMVKPVEMIQSSPEHVLSKPDADMHSQFTVAKVAGLKKLKTSSPKRLIHITSGLDMGHSHGLPSSKLAEHLSAAVHDSSNVQEMLNMAGNMDDDREQGFEVEMERLSSQIDHLKSQNDVLTITLEESKSYSDRLTVLFAKYESNIVALQMTADYSDNLLEAYEILAALYESEIRVLLAKSELAEIAVDGKIRNFDNHADLSTALKSALSCRRSSESRARNLVRKLEPYQTLSSCEDMSISYSLSTSTSSSTVNSADLEYCRQDEDKLREYIHTLKSERAAVKSTVMELESVHLDSVIETGSSNTDSQRLDLENAVLMQELMSMKEEKSELKSQNYLISREKRSLELRLNDKEIQEQSYRVQICHLKAEVKEQNRIYKDIKYRKYGEKDSDSSSDRPSPTASHSDLRSQSPSRLVADLIETQRREEKLRRRVYELVSTLEKISKETEIRHNQSAEFVNDLKQANSVLISSFDKAKKKYQSRMKKLEAQLQKQREYYEAKLHERQKSQSSSASDEGTNRRVNETSL